MGYKRDIRSSAKERVKNPTIDQIVSTINVSKIKVSATIYNHKPFSAEIEIYVHGTFNGRPLKYDFYYKANNKASVTRVINRLLKHEHHDNPIEFDDRFYRLLKQLQCDFYLR